VSPGPQRSRCSENSRGNPEPCSYQSSSGDCRPQVTFQARDLQRHASFPPRLEEFTGLVPVAGQHAIAELGSLNAAHGDLPFLAGDAIVSALNILGDGQERLLVAYEGSNVVAMFLLCRHGMFRWQTFQPSQVPLAPGCGGPYPLPDIARSLLRGPLGLCLGLSITQIDPRIAPRTGDTSDSQSIDYIETGWIDLHGSFDEYWSARGKNLRQNMRKQRANFCPRVSS